MAESLDLLIVGGKIVDGSGAPWYWGDVGISNGKIAVMGKLDDYTADRIIRADGIIVAPGFIDIHSHDDLYVLEEGTVKAKICQGVTSTVIGNCGFGLYPVCDANRELFHDYAASLFGQPQSGEMGYKDLDSFFAAMQSGGTALNVASLTAHGVVRIAVMGFDDRKPTDAEMEEMKRLLRQSLRSGSVGMSLGLIYPPGCYADTAELTELSQVVAEEGGIVTCHMRNEADLLIDSVREMLNLARDAGVPLEISHLKAIGPANSGKALVAVRLIAEAKRRGIDVTFDQYPYVAGSTTATTLLPPWALEGGMDAMLLRLRNLPVRARIVSDMKNGVPASAWVTLWRLIGWDQIMICSVGSEANRRYEGLMVSDIVQEMGSKGDPFEFVLDLLLQENGQVMIITFLQQPGEMEAVMASDLQMFGSDGLPIRGMKAHPRLYGTYPRVLGTYVRERQLLTLERAVFKMAYLPANRLGLRDRGLLRPGMAADIVIFDENLIEDTATYSCPNVVPPGIQMVFVNGVPVMESGILTGERPGIPLKNKR